MKPDVVFDPVVLPEWSTKELAGIRLSPDDHRIAKSLRAGGRSVMIDELRTGLRITATSWIGVVRLSSLELRIVPKLAGDNLRVIEMIHVATNLDAFRRIEAVRQLDAGGANLLDLISLLLVEEAERIVRNGLLADYISREDDLPVVRGRLLADRQMLERFGRVDRVICRYDEREQDVPENQLLAAALECCARRTGDIGVRRRARQLQVLFSQLCDPSAFNLAAGRGQFSYHRLNEHYRDAHELAWLVLEGAGVRDLFQPGSPRSFVFLLDMNRLFEQFVHRMLDWVMKDLPVRVRYQPSSRSIIYDDLSNKPYSQVIPDFLVQSHSEPHRSLAVDAKYKKYDQYRVASSDIYQAFLYAYAFHGGAEQVPAAVLVYPASEKDFRSERLRIRSSAGQQRARLHVVGIPIPLMLDEMKRGSPGPIGQSLADVIQSTISGHSIATSKPLGVATEEKTVVAQV